ncbi:hypothetical protein, conserved [Eimeria tenella]|uniref:Uncharacterized protein n=1 Tax=Eimeria tenella TaxID=5802 RepID=U6L8R8_EIMTE|nr:hypothetical protein, conserved [Eimeria tenella]CDJ44195.1 hypothetical protein, conserved [Eimeria tenella]|eukprot:XP_013234944.1 hypothetical protein, conserved [Eimeria tenella]
MPNRRAEETSQDEALLQKQHEIYCEDVAALRSSSSNSSSIPELQQESFLAANAAAMEVNSGDYTTWYLRRRFLTLNPQYLNQDELVLPGSVCLELEELSGVVSPAVAV